MGIPSSYLPSLSTRTLRDPSDRSGEAPSPQVHPTINLKRLLQIITGIPKPHVLDLGRLCGSNIEWCIRKGFKVYVDDRITSLKTAPPPSVPQKGEKKPTPPTPLEPLDYSPAFFHVVLCWDLLDYLVIKQAQELVADIARILKPKGLLLAFFNFDRSSPPPPTRYRILQEDRLEYERLSLAPIPRQVYENREIQELFSKFDTVNSCFLKNQMREVLVQRR